MEWCVTQHSPEKQKQWGRTRVRTHTHTQVYYKELAHANMEAANPGEPTGLLPVQVPRPEI